LSFPRANRGLQASVVKVDRPAPGDYDVRGAFEKATKKGGAAILYLSG
jgi:hypothetical protein